MPTPTYDLLDSTTLASSASSVTFSSIDQSYRDLILVVELQPPASSIIQVHLRMNADTGSNYYLVGMYGNGSTTGSYSVNAATLSLSYYGTIGSGGSFLATSQIMDYSATDKHKSVLSRIGDTPVAAEAGRWASTSAVTSLEIFKTAYQDFTSGSTFYLFGVAA